jgi:ATP-dependent HslUV protease ATP-binding subunit HslU
VELRFTDAAVHALARVAEEANRLLDNIGARRLHTVLERVLSDISFHAPERVAAARQAGQQEPLVYEVDAPQVETAVADLLKHHDLSRYML